MANVTRDQAFTKSAYAQQANPSTPTVPGTGTWYGIGVDGNYKNRIFFLGGMAAWPSSLKRNRIISAQLRICVRAGERDVQFETVAGNFTPSSVTYNNQPTSPTHYAYGLEFRDNLGIAEGSTADIFLNVKSRTSDDALAIIALLKEGGVSIVGQNSYGASGWSTRNTLSGGGAPFLRVTYSDSDIVKSQVAMYTYLTNEMDPRTANRITWELKRSGSYHCYDETWTQASAKVFWKYSTESSWRTVSISGGTMAYSFPAGTFKSGKTIQYYVQATDADGTTTSTKTYTASTVATQITADRYPSGTTVDTRPAITVSWHFASSAGNYGQGSAKFCWRLAGASSWNSIAASGTTQSLTIPANTFPTGRQIEWYLAGTDADGYASTSPTKAFNTVTTQITPNGYPSGSKVDTRSALSFSWLFVSAVGNYSQKNAKLFWRKQGASSWNSITASGTTQKLSVPAYTFPSGNTIEWYLSGTDAGGYTSNSATMSFSVPATAITADTFPSGSKVDTRSAIPFTWHFASTIGNYAQKSAVLHWRLQGAAAWNNIAASGSTQSASIPANTLGTGKTYEWYVSGSDASGVASQTAVKSFTTPTTQITPDSFPSGTKVDPRYAIPFTWRFVSAVGNYGQGSAKVYWRLQGTATWNIITASGTTQSASIPANTLGTGKVYEWYLAGTDATGAASQTAVKSFTTLTGTIKASEYPAGSSVYTAKAITFKWYFESPAGNYPQSAATLYWKPETETAWRSFAVSGNTQSKTVPANTFPTGATVQWYLRGTDAGGTTTQTGVQSFRTLGSKITPQDSPTSGYADPRYAIVFKWYFDTSAGSVPQSAATLFWKVSTAASYTAVQASGTTQQVTIPANTFPVAATIQWYLQGTDVGGTSSTSSVYSFSTAAGTAYAYARNPIGTAVDGSKPVTLSWTLFNKDGSSPARVTLEWKTPTDTEWTTIRTATAAFTSWTLEGNYFPVGEIEWRVTATNRDGIQGPASTAAFICLRSPDAPSGLKATAVPITTVSWQASGQEAYELSIDGEVVKKAFGPEANSYTVEKPLEDGVHSITVRIQGAYGFWSEPAETTIDVQNVPVGAITLTGSFDVDAALHEEPAFGALIELHWFRDGKEIGRTQNGRQDFADRFVLGEHSYYVELWWSSGYYTRSNTVTGVLKSCVTRIADFEGGEWIELRLSENSDSVQSFRYTRMNSLRHVYGAALPALELAEFEDGSGSYDCAFLTPAEAARFESLKGRRVIVKSRGGNVVIGALAEYTKRAGDFYISYSFSVQQAAWEDYLDVK